MLRLEHSAILLTFIELHLSLRSFFEWPFYTGFTVYVFCVHIHLNFCIVGWTPSTFVSSRNKKVESEFTRRPEDFMDDEDFGEHGIAPRKLVTAGEFTSEERRKRRLDEAKASTQDTAIPGAPALVNLIVPERYGKCSQTLFNCLLSAAC